jgi:hypothetical protein
MLRIVLRAVISLEIASSISYRKLYTELCSDVCRGCGKYGAYLYLLACSRVSYLCFTEDTEFMPMTKQRIKIFWGITSRDLLPQEESQSPDHFLVDINPTPWCHKVRESSWSISSRLGVSLLTYMMNLQKICLCKPTRPTH